MPYISQKRQVELITKRAMPETPGEYTFLIYKATMEEFEKTPKKYADRIAFLNAGFHQYFAALNQGNEALQLAYLGATMEFARSHLFPYEAKKKKQNGDINMKLQLPVAVKEPKKVVTKKKGKEKK